MKLLSFIICSMAILSSMPSCKTSNVKNNDSSPLANLETSGCRGYCPIFRLTFNNDGTAMYEGIRFMEKNGKTPFKITAAELTELRAKIAKADLWKHPDHFESKIADAPSATLTVHEKGKTKSVNGTIDRPKPLLDLEKYMKSLAEKNGIVLRGIDPNTPKDASKAEVIVKLKDDANAGNWIRQFTDLRLQLVRRIPPNNTWLVSYDAEQINEKALIELFKGTKEVVEAQANTKSTERN